MHHHVLYMLNTVNVIATSTSTIATSPIPYKQA